jgi:hypothetical protein
VVDKTDHRNHLLGPEDVADMGQLVVPHCIQAVGAKCPCNCDLVAVNHTQCLDTLAQAPVPFPEILYYVTYAEGAAVVVVWLKLHGTVVIGSRRYHCLGYCTANCLQQDDEQHPPTKVPVTCFGPGFYPDPDAWIQVHCLHATRVAVLCPAHLQSFWALLHPSEAYRCVDVEEDSCK